MKKIYVLLLVMLSAAFVTGCTSTAKNSPSWLSEIAPRDVFWGIGAAKLQDEIQALRVAEARARVNIAEQISTTVQGMLTDYYNEAGGVDNARAVRAIESINRSLVNQEARGAVPRDRWQAKDGTWWVRVEVSKNEMMPTIKQTVNNELADYAEFKADRALQQLEYQLKNSQPAQVPPRVTD